MSEQADLRPGEDTWRSQGHQLVTESVLGFPMPGAGLPSSAYGPIGRLGVS